MNRALILASASLTLPSAGGEPAPGAPQGAAPREDRVPVGNASLYARGIGRGQPIVVLHGGPDFDHVADLDAALMRPSFNTHAPARAK